jgi:PAS domain-containing protein
MAVRNEESKTDVDGSNAKENRSQKPFYGDLVCAAAFTTVTPIDAWKAITTCTEEPEICHIAVLSVIFCALYGGLNWVAYLRHSNMFSFCAFLAGLWLCAFNNIHGWPYPGECVITPQFQGVLAGTLINGALTFRNRLVRFGLMFGVASYVSITSPHSVYRKDVLPLLGGPIVLSIICLSWNWSILLAVKNINWNALTVQGARYLLAGIFMHHTACELLSMTLSTNESSIGVEGGESEHNNTTQAMDTLATIVKASFVACVGVAATGTFQNEIDLNEQLEVLVQKRTKEIQEKSDRLHMVELALRASETAIAITDSNLNIIWLNAACEDIISATAAKGKWNEEEKEQQQHSSSHRQQQETNQSLLGRPLVEVLVLETIGDEKTLTHSFSKSRREDEICIGGMIYHLEVSPYEYSTDRHDINNNSGRYMVVLKNITAERAREDAEKIAREEAMLAKAMGDSMVTLTVSFMPCCERTFVFVCGYYLVDIVHVCSFF